MRKETDLENLIAFLLKKCRVCLFATRPDSEFDDDSTILAMYNGELGMVNSILMELDLPYIAEPLLLDKEYMHKFAGALYHVLQHIYSLIGTYKEEVFDDELPF